MRNAYLFYCLLLVCLASSCRYDKEEIRKSCGLPATVSFQNNIEPIFKANCAKSGCHSGPTATGGLNLDPSVAYSQLMRPGTGYIDTVTPGNSLIYAQMNSAYNPMPPTGPLDSCTRQMVLKWISQKAKNN